ncbi:IpaD/SipD/SspD family type III secretion system needle tip protein [Stenotrophomonas sp.]|uniref:IpaD/SipD/SspD family type III secretion system needle tip protein n=1 Tax=Stenotrophomonas sp. TaxID=69392 RepID=UPI00289B9AA3|nr:IpaD/SipD/SspD family type III secretion system needle tip protein [Stenotrophomonas sp.]
MTTPIDTATAVMSMRPLQALQGQVKQAALEAPTLDPETRSRVLQLGHVARSARTASAQQIRLAEELATTGLSAAGPRTAESLNDAVAMEELKRRQQKESELTAGLRHALQGSSRTQDDMVRAIGFLMPQMLIEDEDSVGLPGFQSPMENPADLDMSGLIWNSHADFFEQISALLGVLQTEWLSKYQDALSNFLEFYKEFSDIMEKIVVTADGDKGNVKIEFKEVREALYALANKYRFSEPLALFSTEGAATAFMESLGLPGMKVQAYADGTFGVLMDVDAVDDIVRSMFHNTTYWDSAEYNAWVSAKDSNMEQIKHVSKVLGEKLNEMTQKYDNIVKILSSSIDKMSEANNSYVHNT